MIEKLQAQLLDTQAEVAKLKEGPRTPQRMADEANATEDGDEAIATPAARQRLRRMCRRRANGTLAVPEEVHKKYAAGGSEREGLLKLLIKSGFNKDFYSSSGFRHLEGYGGLV